MLRKLLLIIICMYSCLAFSQSDAIWRQINNEQLSKIPQQERKIVPDQFDTYIINQSELKDKLDDAVDRFDGGNAIEISFPLGNDQVENFAVYSAGSLEPGLEAKFPNIKSYYGYSFQNPLNKIYFTLTSKGFHGVVRGDTNIYLDPYTPTAKNIIMVYDRKDLNPQDKELFECSVVDSPLGISPIPESKFAAKSFEDRIFHTYRIAISATSEYTAYHNDGNNANGDAFEDALAGIVITLARVNSVFEQEMSVRFKLVEDNDLLIYNNGRNKTNRTEIFDNFDAGQMLSSNTGQINAVIGSGSYDIGHIFSTGGGGVAASSRCFDTDKGKGVTGIVTPEFDAFDIDYVSHEIGHQFGASHTFYNGCFGGSPSSSPFETGSASTIMGYAGICAPNVQDNSDAYFHLISLAQMQNQVDSDVCDVQVSLGSNNPTAPKSLPLTNKTIPKSTPFKLTGDSDIAPDLGEVYTYNWEQLDTGAAAVTGATQPPLSTNNRGPMFRSNFATTDPTRYFPNLQDLSQGIDPEWETLPSVERSMRFFCTIRDNNPLGGQTSYSRVTLNVGDAGPLTVSNPTNTIWYAGSTQNIKWQVNGTSTATYSPNVNIKLSTDGGLTYATTLISNTPNDGSVDIVVPEGVLGDQARLMIEAADNYFFNINSVDFEIKSNSFELLTSTDLLSTCAPDGATINFNYSAAPGFEEQVIFTTSNLPAGLNITFSKNNLTASDAIELNLSNTSSINSGAYDFQLVATTTSTVVKKNLVFKVFENEIGNVQLLEPANGAQNQVSNPLLTWMDLESAATYVIRIASDSQMVNVIETTNVGNATSYKPVNLQSGKIYYWSVQPINGCIDGDFTSINVFQTAQEVCRNYDQVTFFNDKNSANDQWASDSNNAVSALITISDDIEMTDVSFYMKALHDDTGDLKMQFRAPSGTFSEVYNRECANGKNFDVTIADDATQAFGCNSNYTGILSGRRLPGQSFQRFHGQSAKGQWELLATDRVNNEIGGTFEKFSIKVCGRLQYVNEFSHTVNELSAVFNEAVLISTSNLIVEQSGSNVNDLIYILTSKPEYGDVKLNGTVLSIGDSFTQANVNLGSLSFEHSSTSLVYNDELKYIVKGSGNTLMTENSLPISISKPILIYDYGWLPFAPSLETETLVARVVSGDPELTTGAIVRNLRVLSGQSLTVSAPLKIVGNLNVSGNMTATTLGSVTMENTSSQIIKGGGDISIARLILENSSGITIKSSVNITEILDPKNSTLITNGNITFKSSVDGTAQLANSDQATITGEVTVERYIPARRAFRFLASPVNTSRSIYENWQENGQNVTGLGTHITGSKTGANGFDATVSGNASLYRFDNDNYQWIKATDTDVQPLAVGTGYRLLVRGDRTTDLSSNNAVASPTVIRATGTLRTGTVSTNYETSNQEFALLGNPYQAVVDGKLLMESNTTSGISSAYLYAWDPNLNSRGGYVTIDLDSSNGIPTPSSSGANKFIQPGQSFFVKTTGVSSIQFKEQFKAVGTSSLSVFSTPADRPEITISLGTGNQTKLDELRIVFSDNYENEVTDVDASKFYNQDETLAVNNNGVLLSVEKRMMPVETDILPLFMDQLRHTEYTIEVRLEGALNMNAILVDQLTGTETNLNEGSNSVDFGITEDPASKATDRFYLKFEKATLGLQLANAVTLKLFPNPTSNRGFTITHTTAAGNEMSLKVFNTLGQQIFTQSYAFNGLQKIQLEPSIADGIYLVQIEIAGQKKTFRLVLN